MDTRDDDVETGPPSGIEDILESAQKSSTVGSSISVDSRTSTIKYSQEPFDQYRARVEALCHSLWPAGSRVASLERRMSSVTRPRIPAFTKMRRFLFPSSGRGFIIERLAGGTYNRITGVTVKADGTNDVENFVLRVPRPQMAEFGYIEREVAILRYVRQHTTLPVANVIASDATPTNALGSGYVLQSRIPGVPLHTIWDELTHEQRCIVAQEIGKIILALQDVKNPTPGIVEATQADDGTQKFFVRPFDIRSPCDVDWKAKIPHYVPNDEVGSATQTPEEWFATQFGRWLANELLENPAQILYWDYQYQFVQVTKQMDSLGILGDGQNSLCHFDLAARNIIVQPLPDGSLNVSGVVDWDSAAFAPTFVSCAPPSWLWTDQKHYDAEESEESGTPTTPQQQQLKEVFDDTVGFDWTWLAYEPEYRLARELFHFAQHGLPDGEAQKKAVRFLKEWAALYHARMNPQKNDEDSKEHASKSKLQEDEAMEEVGQGKEPV